MSTFQPPKSPSIQNEEEDMLIEVMMDDTFHYSEDGENKDVFATAHFHKRSNSIND